MERDTKGRFTKKSDEEFKIILGFPSFKKIIVWILIIKILMLWMSFLWKFSIIKKIMDLFDEIIFLTPNNPDNGIMIQKKEDYFIN